MTRRASGALRILPRRRRRPPGEVRDSRAAALEEADALLRAGALVDLAKMATTATTDGRRRRRGGRRSRRARAALAALRTMRARVPASGEKVPEPPDDGAVAPPPVRARVPRAAPARRRGRAADVLTAESGRRRASDSRRDVLTRAGAWLLAASIPSGSTLRRSDGKATWRRVFASAKTAPGLAPSSRESPPKRGPVLVCVRTKAGDVLGGYALAVRGQSVRGTGRSFKETREPSSLRLARLKNYEESKGKTRNGEGGGEVDSDDADDASDADASDDSWTRVGVYASTGANADHVWCASGFSSDRFPNGFGFGGVANRPGGGRSAIWIDGNLERGRCVPGIATFAAPMLAGCSGVVEREEERVDPGFVRLWGEPRKYDDDWGVGWPEVDAVEAGDVGRGRGFAGGTNGHDRGIGERGVATRNTRSCG